MIEEFNRGQRLGGFNNNQIKDLMWGLVILAGIEEEGGGVID